LSNSIQLTEKPDTAILRSVLRSYSRYFFYISAIICLIFLANTGCRRHKPTKPTPDIKTDEQYWVRVLLLDNIQECSLRVDSDFSIEQEDNPPQSKKVTTNYKSHGKSFVVGIIDGQLTIFDQNNVSSQIIISPDKPYVFNLNDKPYRGKARIILNPDGTSFDVINLLPLESYIAGVAGAEMPDYWEPEALKCQVIAARTYCLFIKKRFGKNRLWDLNKTAANQVYLGMEAESPSVWKAVNETSGMVLTCRQNNGTQDIFPAYYSSTCGGHTENSENVFGDSYEPLKGVECGYCKKIAKPEIFFWPDIEFEKADIIKKLANRYPNLSRLGDNVEFSVDKQSDYEGFSRITRMKISGPNNISEFLRAEDFRLVIDPSGQKIKSTACKLNSSDNKMVVSNGRGWGHGVGMCQCGVQGMAREGKKAEEILEYYYPGSKILKIEYK
jgi:stage II sporulation protein D